MGSLARSGTEGASILSNSYWFLYLVYLIPVLALAAMVVMILYLAFNWKLFSDSLGFGMAMRKRMGRKKNNTIGMAVWTGFWFLALGVLLWKCGGIFCRPENSTQTIPQTVAHEVGNATGSIPSPFAALGSSADAVASLLGSSWFAWTFMGLLIVSSLILARSVKVSMDEAHSGHYIQATVKAEGSLAVQDALRILKTEDTSDPRTRILACYEIMIRAAASLGAHVGLDKTARELEKGIRDTFQLEGSGIRELTRLFEEARYSLHHITEADSQQAQLYLMQIGEELKVTIKVEN